MNDLKFTDEKRTVAEMKEATGVGAIDIVKSPKTGKLFFSAGSTVGAVAKKGYSERPMFTKVIGDEGSFWLLHNQSDSNVVDSL